MWGAFGTVRVVRGRQAAKSLLARCVSLDSGGVLVIYRVDVVVNLDVRWVSELTVVTYGDAFCLLGDGALDHVEQAVDLVDLLWFEVRG